MKFWKYHLKVIFFEFNPAGLEKEFNPEFQKYWQVPNPHFFQKYG